ncbi:hypothetical protein GMD78_16075 [Ornithinibacillus sp. L9]|uniref:RNA polymerase subunit sigma n=1 Tax=Ornithinibacillus caprae TaxID=2678566 RepID=A0A6N8FQL0_9BACI|nr:hypothetical protein [Ornithinibacillus caprae]MUK89888.1 hypothetical protein [Ornithinibacillus caprae]
MSWKSIELQVALPRTQDAGKLQDQMLKQNQHFQESLVQSQLKQEELKRKKVQQQEDVAKTKLEDEENNSTTNQHDTQRKNSTKNKKQSIDHPYLGNKFDFTG